MEKAVFLDRDGTIIHERGDYNYLPEHVSYPDGVAESLHKVQQAGYKLFVVTNQGGIAKGLYTHSHVVQLHVIIGNWFSTHGVYITDWVWCPHHPVSGECLCRKPNTLMLEKLMARYNIDPRSSFMIGDADRDVEAAEKVSIKGILIPKNEGLEDAVKQICK